MKRCLMLLAACLLLTACGSPAASSSAASSPAVSAPVVSMPAPPAQSDSEEVEIAFEFTGVVLDLSADTARVSVDAECVTPNIGDVVTFPTDRLAEIGVKTGDRVWVGCGEVVLETDPARVDALTWTVLQSESAAPEHAPATVVYDHSGDAMSVTLPVGWEYEELGESAPQDLEDLYSSQINVIRYTITFYPVADKTCRAELVVEQAAPAVDLTGVSAEERLCKNAGAATVYTEETDDGRLIYVQFAAEDGRYSVRWAPTRDQLRKYETTFWTIVDTMTIGNEV